MRRGEGAKTCISKFFGPALLSTVGFARACSFCCLQYFTSYCFASVVKSIGKEVRGYVAHLLSASLAPKL
jgi:hypothetical protein